jgi:hypothetical protein
MVARALAPGYGSALGTLIAIGRVYGPAALVFVLQQWRNPRPLLDPRVFVRVSRDREHGFQTIVSTDFTAS